MRRWVYAWSCACRSCYPLRASWLLLLASAGCAYHWPSPPGGILHQRILKPHTSSEETIGPNPSTVSGKILSVDNGEQATIRKPTEAPEVYPLADSCIDGLLTLEKAIAVGLANSPRLAYMRERSAAARAGKQVAFAGFLPEARTFYRNIQGAPETSKFSLPTIPTLVGNVAYGGQSDNFQLAELHVQWTVWDFGRTPGRYGRAVATAAVADLLFRRAIQTLTFNITAAYFSALDASARRIIAEESVRRAQSHLHDARGFLAQGTFDKNDLYRAELQLADMRLFLVNAQTEEGVAIAALNRVLGINVSAPTKLVDRKREPTTDVTLAHCLELAIGGREELAAAQQSILDAQLGAGISKADYMPKIYVAGDAAHIDGEGIRASELLSGGVNIELDLFTGGRKIGAQKVAAAEVRAAIAQAKEICDTIAFEVNDAYLSLTNARERIAVSRVAVEQATENLRVYNARFRRGDATPTDVVDAELSITRSQQNYMTALYDYQTAVARLAYAVGTSEQAVTIEQQAVKFPEPVEIEDELHPLPPPRQVEAKQSDPPAAAAGLPLVGALKPSQGIPAREGKP